MRTVQSELPILIFDGKCSFCTGAADWVAAHCARPADLVPWQRADLVAMGLTSEQARRAVWWAEPGGELVHSERAIARALLACGKPWCLLGRLIVAPGIRPLTAVIYRFVARHRGRLPGPAPACRRDRAADR